MNHIQDHTGDGEGGRGGKNYRNDTCEKSQALAESRKGQWTGIEAMKTLKRQIWVQMNICSGLESVHLRVSCASFFCFLGKLSGKNKARLD
jgi:hypothetical protein